MKYFKFVCAIIVALATFIVSAEYSFAQSTSTGGTVPTSGKAASITFTPTPEMKATIEKGAAAATSDAYKPVASPTKEMTKGAPGQGGAVAPTALGEAVNYPVSGEASLSGEVVALSYVILGLILWIALLNLALFRKKE